MAASADQIDHPRRIRDRETIAERARHRHAKHRPLRADAEVARHRDRAAAAGGDAVDLGDRDERQPLDAIDHRVEPLLVGHAVGAVEVLELRDVGAGGESAVRSAYDEDADVAVGFGGLAGLDQRVVHLPRQRIARFGATERDDSDGSLDVPGDVARWHNGSRCDPGDGRAVLRDVTGGHGRAGDQSRAARRRLDAHHGRGPRQRQPGLQRRQPRQAWHGPRSPATQGPRGVRAPRQFGRHRHRELPPRRDGAHGPRLRDLEPAEPAVDLRLDLRARTNRPVGVERRLRSDRAGAVGADVGHRERRRHTGESRRAAHRSERRPVRADRRARGAAQPHADRPRPAHRHLARRCGARALGVGGDGVLHVRTGARSAGLRASHERALPGLSLLGRLRHHRRGERSQFHEARARARASRMDRRLPIRGRSSAGATSRRARGDDQRGHRARTARVLDRTVGSGGRAMRADSRL